MLQSHCEVETLPHSPGKHLFLKGIFFFFFFFFLKEEQDEEEHQTTDLRSGPKSRFITWQSCVIQDKPFACSGP